MDEKQRQTLIDALDVMRKAPTRNGRIAEAAVEILLFWALPKGEKPRGSYTPDKKWEHQLVGQVLIRHGTIIAADRQLHDFAAGLLGEKKWGEEQL